VTGRGPTGFGKAAATGLCLLFASPGFAQSVQEQTEALQRTQQELDDARRENRALSDRREALAVDLKRLRERLVILAQDTQERESIITNLERQLDQLTLEKQQRTQDLKERNAQLGGTLSALARLSRAPSQSVLFQPGGVLKAVRGAHLLETSIPVLQDRAAVLGEQLVALNAVEQDILNKLSELATAETALTADRENLAALVAEKNGLLSDVDTAVNRTNDRIARLVKEATSLEDLLERLNRGLDEGEAPSPPNREPEADQTSVTSGPVDPSAKPEGLRSFPPSGPINRPARGDIVRTYGQDAGFGQTSKGIVIRTRPDAQVTATFDGKVAFSGQFQGLGLILIIEHSDGYHSVLAGMSRLDAATGQWILAGEPVGVMPSAETAEVDKDGSEALGLYVELRREGQPINPMQWISG